ncbi:hypothetical protein PPERSA_06396 [Pseudocohnilembus persalinus]|uniref:Uncharacterized protein n=1 Tax=Pseudocohnilembus persalinus TaxID=266149 RepID=A0A0V0Q8P0_PSEPJ|nr:hypothetical protein PPERSA_06396 [Pseudocohnilembus persalinus]|eukprot:KRW98592.1 hypothetical protein PPERSA_06396 [Pseudocohnilembus persalinus]
MRHRGSVSDSQENSENLDDEQNEDYLDLQDIAQTDKNQQQDQQGDQMEDGQEQNNKESASGQESIGKNEKKISIESIENINIEQDAQKEYVNEFLNELESPNQIVQRQKIAVCR